jgi:hypothetical protein
MAGAYAIPNEKTKVTAVLFPKENTQRCRKLHPALASASEDMDQRCAACEVEKIRVRVKE